MEVTWKCEVRDHVDHVLKLQIPSRIFLVQLTHVLVELQEDVGVDDVHVEWSFAAHRRSDAESFPKPGEGRELRLTQIIPRPDVGPTEHGTDGTEAIAPRLGFPSRTICERVWNLPDHARERVRQLLEEARLVVHIDQRDHPVPDVGPVSGRVHHLEVGSALPALVVLVVTNIDEDGRAVITAVPELPVFFVRIVLGRERVVEPDRLALVIQNLPEGCNILVDAGQRRNHHGTDTQCGLSRHTTPLECLGQNGFGTVVKVLSRYNYQLM